MTQTISAAKISLIDLRERFGLQRVNDLEFFREWQENLPSITPEERQIMDEVKAEYLHLFEYPLLESVVKLVVLSPLLKQAGFYRSPFYIVGEKEVRVLSQDEEMMIQGKLDLLIFIPQFWVLVIEAKKSQYSLDVGIPQALTYMLANPLPQHPAYGFVTNGTDCIFLKLIQQDTPKYAESDVFSLRRRENELYTVLSILKRLAEIVT
ncbi:MAG: restriction endonuclease subunit R [Cyanobacteriota bacterium]|nr:restriction endonuclease subunit R [Cyanobacteriota bacterium]